MRIRKFQASTLKDALAQVKAEMGADAMIVSTTPVRRGLLGGGIEVTAAIDEPVPVSPPSPLNSNPRYTTQGLGENDVDRILSPLRAELRSLRAMLRTVAEDRVDRALREEVAALRQAIAPLGSRLQPEDGGESIETIARTHRIAAPATKRITVIVGPTGVGKTTTIAKLATHAALVENKKVAIASLDTYRVGGEEQIRIFADLIGVPLVLISDAAHFDHAIDRLDSAERIFVDTSGRSPRDPKALAQLAAAFANTPDLEVHLALAAATTPASMDAWYARCKSLGLHRLLMTKLDEAEDLGQIVRAPARMKLPISYVTTGQRVPEDIEQASQERLVAMATTGFLQEELAA